MCACVWKRWHDKPWQQLFLGFLFMPTTITTTTTIINTHHAECVWTNKWMNEYLVMWMNESTKKVNEWIPLLCNFANLCVLFRLLSASRASFSCSKFCWGKNPNNKTLKNLSWIFYLFFWNCGVFLPLQVASS